MNRIVICICVAALAAAVAPADEPAQEPVVAETLFSDGRTNTWTQADLIAALQLMNRKYHRDCETSSGRHAWHGKLVAQSVDTNALVKTETYADGTVFTFPFAEKAAAAKPKTTLTTRGVPVALAAARQRREAEKAQTNVVTVTVTAGEGN